MPGVNDKIFQYETKVVARIFHIIEQVENLHFAPGVMKKKKKKLIEIELLLFF